VNNLILFVPCIFNLWILQHYLKKRVGKNSLTGHHIIPFAKRGQTILKLFAITFSLSF
jgi:hypothetical protein